VTWDTFSAQMARLDGLKFKPHSLQSHWEQLHDMPEVLLSAAVEKAQAECSDFPSPKMLKIFAEAVRSRVIPVPPEEDRGADLPEPVELGTIPQAGLTLKAKRTWTYYDEACSDSGWQTIWCGETPPKPWLDRGHCGRNQEHLPHEFVVVCPCSTSNPAVIRRRERERQVGRRGGTE
jgi:hypothetical protein